MRAVVLRGGRLEVRETPDPVPGPGELLVRTVSTAICASDIHYMDHPDPSDTSGMFVWDAERDVVMGHEFVGEVVGHGEGCSDAFPIGARVTSIPILIRSGETQVIGQHPEAPGSFGELFLVSEMVARVVPDEADADAVAVTDAFAVGEGYVAMSGIGAGQIPLVIGAGAIGLSAVAALATRGVDPIVIADFNDDRLALAARFGAHITVNASTRWPYDVWNEVAAERGVTAPPVIFECVGATGLLQQIVDACPMGSKIFAAGGWYTGDSLDVTPGDEEVADDPVRRCARRRRLVPHARRDHRRHARSPAEHRHDRRPRRPARRHRSGASGRRPAPDHRPPERLSEFSEEKPCPIPRWRQC
jgi:threonine dehydrogenase-like Zn-dependent dehydrogenase